MDIIEQILRVLLNITFQKVVFPKMNHYYLAFSIKHC